VYTLMHTHTVPAFLGGIDLVDILQPQDSSVPPFSVQRY
jgi:hypothetical protein